VDKLKHYRIPFVGLKNGIHEFYYNIDENFFSLFENSEIKNGQIEVDLTFDKHDSFFILDYSIGGTVETNCDRCSERFSLEILDKYRVYVKFDGEVARSKDDRQDDIIYISPFDTHLDVSQLIYEFTNLSIPIQKICSDKKTGSPGCNKKVIKILEQNTSTNKDTDPRWAALKKFK